MGTLNVLEAVRGGGERLEVVLGHSMKRPHQPTRASNVHDSQADDSLLRSLYPDSCPVDLGEGLAHTVAWVRTLPSGAGA